MEIVGYIFCIPFIIAFVKLFVEGVTAALDQSGPQNRDKIEFAVFAMLYTIGYLLIKLY
jgi:hypothetical protein